MDDAVLRAMAKWPNVPAVYDWLGLSRRGRWLLQGDPIAHEASVRFISRNYAADDRGCWYFQNGPQRVFVALEYTPYVYALDSSGAITAHTGQAPVSFDGLWLDDCGGILLRSELGVGVLDDRDLASMSECFVDASGVRASDDRLEEVFADPVMRLPRHPLSLDWRGERLNVHAMSAAQVPSRFGFVTTPAD